MTQSCMDPTRVRRFVRGVTIFASFATCLSGSVSAAPPIDPTPMPFYSFDEASPHAQGGIIGPADILIIESPNPTPVVDVPGALLGLGVPGDELDALALPRTDMGPNTSFALLFSVDRATAGNVAPDAALVALQVPYNVTDQANKGQAAGDQYMSMALCTLASGCQVGGRALAANNVLNRNNYDEGGTDFSADPPASADNDASGIPQDNVDATAASSASMRAITARNVYFSAESPPRPRSEGSSAADYEGADILYSEDPHDPTGETTMFGSYLDFDLQLDDDIDAMIVFDTNSDGVFNGTDVVLLSLVVDSPTLEDGSWPDLCPSASPCSPADVFKVSPGAPPELFVSAAQLGLGQPPDNIDALDVLLCDNAEACATVRGIRKLPVPTVSEWGLVVMALILLAAGTLVFRHRSRRGTA